MRGLMQDRPLQVSAILRFAEDAHPAVKIVSRQADGSVRRGDYAALGAALRAVGTGRDAAGGQAGRSGGNIGLEHRSAHGIAVCRAGHRRRAAHGQSPAFGRPARPCDQSRRRGHSVPGSNFFPLLARLLPRLESIRQVVVLSGEVAACGVAGGLDYEALLAGEADSGFDWPLFDEHAGAVLCYTSGTTGDPKGVLYSHRSIVLHALASGLPGTMNLSAFDVIMPCSSLYHAIGWGLPYSAPINGCGFVLPCDRMDAASLHELIEGEGVTFAAGVPTVWTGYLRYLDEAGLSAARLRRMLIGGSAVPRAMFEAFRVRNIEVLQLWGMTETSPVAWRRRRRRADGAGGRRRGGRAVDAQGRRVFGVDLRVVDEMGQAVPEDGVTPGALQVRGFWVVQRYFRADADAVDADGWFDTGDIATIDAQGFIRLTDRAKDVIKSGGEWVSSIELENEACACPGVRIAAAVGVPHPRWDERPILVVERHEDCGVGEAEITAFLAGRVVEMVAA